MVQCKECFQLSVPEWCIITIITVRRRMKVFLSKGWWRQNCGNYAAVMESVPSESLMSLLKSTIENWFPGKKKEQLCLQKRASGGELVSIVVHLIDREPTCRETPLVQLIIMKGAEFFLNMEKTDPAFHSLYCHMSGGRCLITYVCACVSVRACVRQYLLHLLTALCLNV